jgi:hypothetical protein
MTQKCTAESKQKGIEAEKMFQKWLDRLSLFATFFHGTKGHP